MFDRLEEANAGQSFPFAETMDAIPWGDTGLIAAVAQQFNSGEVLMLAWMNRSRRNDGNGVRVLLVQDQAIIVAEGGDIWMQTEDP